MYVVRNDFFGLEFLWFYGGFVKVEDFVKLFGVERGFVDEVIIDVWCLYEFIYCFWFYVIIVLNLNFCCYGFVVICLELLVNVCVN